MAKSLQKQERYNETSRLASDFRRKHSGVNIRQLFVERTVDADFAEIGRSYIGAKRSANMDMHIPVWVGFEVVTNSRYLT